MVKVYIKERINDQTTICSGGVTGNTTYLGRNEAGPEREAEIQPRFFSGNTEHLRSQIAMFC